MDLPNIERGMRILADDINRISREVRASALTSVIGGTFTRSASGTSIAIDGTFFGGAGSAIPCPFKITDASTSTAKKIEIAQNTVNVNTGARWPQGMGIGYPPYLMTITETSYIYIKLSYVVNDVIVRPEEDAITIANETELQENTVNDEYVLIGIVQLNGQALTITNQCVQITANPCNLKWN